MKKHWIPFVFICAWQLNAFCQPNCKVYDLAGDTACYQACQHAIKAIEIYQGLRQSQLHFDSAIMLCPTFAFAYAEKSVPYLKRGDFITWRKLINQAVALDPTSYLPVRASGSYQFLRDYEHTIADLDLLDSLINYDLGYTTNGQYNLGMIRALCHRGLGNIDTAIVLASELITQQGYTPGLYDYLHLSAMLIENGQYEAALDALTRQREINGNLAEVEFFSGLAQGGLQKFHLEKDHLFVAEQLLVKGHQMFDPYTHPPDKISIGDIENAIAKNRKSLIK